MDYEKIGLRCGLEIHQQLEGRKLFTPSPTLIRDDDAHYEIIRTLTSVAGESGVVDAAALVEAQKGKQFVYRGYTDTISLVELDEQPPEPMNEDALHTSLQLAKMLSAHVCDEVHVMRKTVVDGSNTSGFQRTALIAYDGELAIKGLRIGIPTICLEEDSAQIVERSASKDVYNLSRLGIPLIEISTTPSIRTPEQAKLVAWTLGMYLRSTGRVKRGLGTIRQDVNVSVREGARVEIKGAQDLDMIPTIVENEAKRQLSLVALRPAISAFALGDVADVASVFSSTSCTFIKKSGTVFACRVSAGAGVLGKELQPGRRLGTDLSDFAKVHAGIGGILHSDEELTKYKISEAEIAALRKQLGCAGNDGFIIIVAALPVAQRGFAAVLDRIAQLSQGVPSEVRKALDDGTSSYLRPMPGAARMYPETDVWPFSPAFDGVVPELITDKALRYQKEYSLSKDLAEHVASGGAFLLFEELVSVHTSLKPASIAEIITSTPVTLKRKHGIDAVLSDEVMRKIVGALSEGRIAQQSIVDIVKEYLDCGNLDAAFDRFVLLDEAAVRTAVESVVSDLGKDAPRGKIMGEIMRRTGGKADGKLVQQMLAELL